MPWNFPILCIPMMTDKLDSTLEILILHHLIWTVVKIQSKYMETFNDKYDIHHMSANQELFLIFVGSCEITFFHLGFIGTSLNLVQVSVYLHVKNKSVFRLDIMFNYFLYVNTLCKFYI